MTDPNRCRPIAGQFSYRIPRDDELKSLSQNGMSKLRLLQYENAPVETIPLWPMIGESERSQIREALRAMTFNKARLIQDDLACLMIALDPVYTMKKAMAEGFIIAHYGSQSATAPAFCDYLRLAQEYACYVGIKETLEFADIFESLPFRLNVIMGNSSPAYVASYMGGVLTHDAMPLRLKISGDKARSDIYGVIDNYSNQNAWVPFTRIHACDMPDPVKAVSDGAFFDPNQAPDVASLGDDCDPLRDFNWRNRLNLDLVDHTEKAQYLTSLAARFPDMGIIHKVLRIAMIQDPEALKPAIRSLSQDKAKLLLDRRLITREHVSWLSASARDHLFSADLGL